MLPVSEVPNFDIFRDSLATLLLQCLGPASTSGAGKEAGKKRSSKGRKNEIKPVSREPKMEDDGKGAELSEFVEYLAEEMYISLPPDLRTLSYAATQDDASLADKYSLPLDSSLVQTLGEGLPPSVADSLTTYDLIEEPSSLDRFLERVLGDYVRTSTTVPPEHTPAVTAAGCEICGREHLPLTYHHLIPRQMHAKALKRGWAREWELGKVAWLCRACHSFVHKVVTNEELARELNGIEALMEREDVQKWAAWVGKVRWKAR